MFGRNRMCDVRGTRLKVTGYSTQSCALFVLYRIELNNCDRCLTVNRVRIRKINQNPAIRGVVLGVRPQIHSQVRASSLIHNKRSGNEIGARANSPQNLHVQTSANVERDFHICISFFGSSWSSQLQDTD